VAVYSLIYGWLYPPGIGESVQKWNYDPPFENMLVLSLGEHVSLYLKDKNNRGLSFVLDM